MAASVLPYLTVLSNIRCNLIPHQVKRNYYFQPYSDGFLKGYTLQCCPKAMVFHERYCRCVPSTAGHKKPPHSTIPYKHKFALKSKPPFKMHSSLPIKKNKKDNQNYKIKNSAIFHNKLSLPDKPYQLETGSIVRHAYDVDRIVPVYPKRFHRFMETKQSNFATEKNKNKKNRKNRPKFRFFNRRKFFGRNHKHLQKQSSNHHMPAKSIESSNHHMPVKSIESSNHHTQVKSIESSNHHMPVKSIESKLNLDRQKLDHLHSNIEDRLLGIKDKDQFREFRRSFWSTSPFQPSFDSKGNRQHLDSIYQRNILSGEGTQIKTGIPAGIFIKNSGKRIQDFQGSQNAGSLVGNIHGETGIGNVPVSSIEGIKRPNRLVQTELNTVHIDGIIHNEHLTKARPVIGHHTSGDKTVQQLVQNKTPNGGQELIQITNDGLLQGAITSGNHRLPPGAITSGNHRLLPGAITSGNHQRLSPGFDLHSNFGKFENTGPNLPHGTVSVTPTGGVISSFPDINMNGIATEIGNPIAQLDMLFENPKTTSFDQVQVVDNTINLKSKNFMKSFENEAVFLEDISGKIATSSLDRKGVPLNSKGLSVGDSIALQLEHFRKMKPRSIDLQNTIGINQDLTRVIRLPASTDLIGSFSTSTDLGSGFSTSIGSLSGFKTPTNPVSAGSLSGFKTPTNPVSLNNIDGTVLQNQPHTKSNTLFSGFEINEGKIFDQLNGGNPTVLLEGIQSNGFDTSTTGVLNPDEILRQGFSNNILFDNVELKTGTKNTFLPVPSGTAKHSPDLHSDLSVIKNGKVITKLAEFVNSNGKGNQNVDNFRDKVFKEKTIILTNSNQIPEALQLHNIFPEIIPPKPHIPVSLQKQTLGISKKNTKTMRFTEVLPGDICLGCKMDGGVGYTDHPASCDRFVVCYPIEGGILKPITQLCPYGLFWSQSALTCKLTKDVFCPHEVCKYQLDKYQYASKRTCRSYWECQNGISVPRCCPWGHSYLDGRGCIEDSTCEIPDVACSVDRKSYVVEWGGICDKRPVAGKNNLYERKNHTIWIEERCPSGWIYKVELCECTKITELAPPDYIFDGHQCVPEIYLPFTSDFADHSGNNVYVRVDNTSLISGAACFDGQSALAIPAFANMDYGGTLYVHVRYKQRNPSENLQSLVFNGDCGKIPTLVLGTKPSGNSVSVLTNLNEEKKMWVNSKRSVTDWRDVWLKLENGKLVLQTKDHTASTPLNGAISRSECGMKIGWGKGFDNFVGCIDERRNSLTECNNRSNTNTTGDTCVAEDAHSSGTPDPTPDFVWSSCRPCVSSIFCLVVSLFTLILPC